MSPNPRDLESLLAHDGFVRAVARGLLLDDARVDDVVQQTWVAALEGAPDAPRSIRAWLASVARNFARDSRRRDAARTLRERAAARPEGVPSMARILERESMRRAVVEAVAELEEPYQSAILLRFFENLPPREMARRLGVPAETARTRVKRALERLRAKLQGERLLDGDGWSSTLFQLASVPAAATATGTAATTATALGPIALALASAKAWIGAAAIVAVATLVWFVATSGPAATPPALPGATPPAVVAAPAPPIERSPAKTPPAETSSPPPAKEPVPNVARAPVAIETPAPIATSRVPVNTPSPAPAKNDDAPLLPAGPALAPSVRGRVRFIGTAPERKPIEVQADAACHAAHASDPLLPEDLVVNPNGTLRNVFVRVVKGLEGKRFDVPADPVMFDQIGCRYTPHVVGIQVGQTWRIRNSDPTLHNVHPMPKKNTPFNQGMPEKAADKDYRFKNPELSVAVRCDVHPWMSAVVHVVDHPFFAVTGDAGEFTIGRLPPGTYTIAALHEKLGASEPVEVRLGEGETKEIEFVYRAK